MGKPADNTPRRSRRSRLKALGPRQLVTCPPQPNANIIIMGNSAPALVDVSANGAVSALAFSLHGKKLCGQPTHDGTPCRNPAGCSVNHGTQHSISGAMDDQASSEAQREALSEAERPASGLDWDRIDQGLAQLALMRDISHLPPDGTSTERGNELIDRFTEECVLSNGKLLNERVFGPNGLGGPDLHKLRHGDMTRRGRKKFARRMEQPWDETAERLRNEGAGQPRSELELQECVSAAQALDRSGERYDRNDVADLVSRRRRRLLGRGQDIRPSGVALDACAWGQYARERVFELYGDNSGTAQAAALHVGRRCRQTYFDEQMTTPRLPTQSPAAAA